MVAGPFPSAWWPGSDKWCKFIIARRCNAVIVAGGLVLVRRPQFLIVLIVQGRWRYGPYFWYGGSKHRSSGWKELFLCQIVITPVCVALCACRWIMAIIIRMIQHVVVGAVVVGPGRYCIGRIWLITVHIRFQIVRIYVAKSISIWQLYRPPPPSTWFWFTAPSASITASLRFWAKMSVGFTKLDAMLAFFLRLLLLFEIDLVDSLPDTTLRASPYGKN